MERKIGVLVIALCAASLLAGGVANGAELTWWSHWAT